MTNKVTQLKELYSKKEFLNKEIKELEDTIFNHSKTLCGTTIKLFKTSNTSLIIRNFIFFQNFHFSFLSFHTLSDSLIAHHCNWEMEKEINTLLLIEMFDKKPGESFLEQTDYLNSLLISKSCHLGKDLNDYFSENLELVFQYLNKNIPLDKDKESLLRNRISYDFNYFKDLVSEKVKGFNHADFQSRTIGVNRQLYLVDIFAKLKGFTESHKLEFLMHQLNSQLKLNDIIEPISKI